MGVGGGVVGESRQCAVPAMEGCVEVVLETGDLGGGVPAWCCCCCLLFLLWLFHVHVVVVVVVADGKEEKDDDESWW